MPSKRAEELRNALSEEVKKVDQLLIDAGEEPTSKIGALIESLHVYQTELEMQNIALDESNQDNETLRLYYSSLFSLAPLPCAVVDSRLNILESNKATNELQADAWLNNYQQNSLVKIFESDCAQKLYERVNKVLGGVSVEPFEVTAKLKKEQRFFNVHTRRLHAETKSNPICMVMLEDITVHKQYLQQQQLFLDLLNNANDMLLVFSKTGEMLESSEQANIYFGKVSSKLTLEQLPKSISEYITNYIENVLPDARKKQQIIEFESEVQEANRFLLVRCFPIMESGQVKAAGVILLDDTQRVLQEQELSLAIRVFNEGTQAVMITDATQTIIQVNLAFEEVTGYITEEVIGQNPNILSSGVHDAEFYANFWSCIQTKGTWEGEIWNKRKNGDIYPQWLSVSSHPKYASKPTNYLAVFRDITDQKDREREVHELAFYDPLTRCGNRRKLEESFNSLIEEPSTKSISLFLFDVDYFKEINDVHGHDVGDQFLVALVGRIQHLIRESDNLFRLGGDEFLVMFANISEEDSTKKAKELLATCQSPFHISRNELHTTISIGISQYPDNGEDFLTLFKNADTALYKAKEAGRNRLEYFAPELLESMERDDAIERYLRKAITDNQLSIAFMPMLSVKTETVSKVEVLSRWDPDELGQVSPDEYISVAEKCGLIHSLTEIVFQKTKGFLDEHYNPNSALKSLSINISSLDFTDPEFLFRCVDILPEEYRPLITLEITESSLLKNTKQNIEVIKALQAHGIKISIDDFGTGFSSLNYLAHFAVDEIKIDKSFIDEIDTEESQKDLCEAILGLIHALGCSAVAEGVENTEQLYWLKSKGCDYIQGYEIGKPVSGTELMKSYFNED